MKPILFNTEMVRAILDGRKKVTRRVMKPQPTAEAPMHCYAGGCKRDIGRWHDKSGQWWKPPCNAEDTLYVRETWAEWEGGYTYKADDIPVYPHAFVDKWHPSIHMPKEAARLFLRVKAVRVERLQEITEEQCDEEGVVGWTKDEKLYKYAPADEENDSPCWPWPDCPYTPQDAMQRVWDNTIKPADLPQYGWSANPWVWVIEFERVSKEEAL